MISNYLNNFPGVDNDSFEDFKNETLRASSPSGTIESNNRKEILHSYYENKNYSTASLHFLMFVAGALAVSAFHKKQEVVTFAYRKLPTVKMMIAELFLRFNLTAAKSRVAYVRYSHYFWEIIKTASFKICNRIRSLKLKRTVKHNKIHLILLKKLKEMAEERKNLGHLLISAIRENKNVRLRYELETMTKKRLMQHIEDTQKQINKNRSRYVTFQRLYLVTHQENTYLKSRLVKLKQEKNESDKNLMGLINEVYKSKNNDLKTYCTRFLVKTKDKVLNSDVGAEIEEFLANSRKASEITLTPRTQVSFSSTRYNCSSIRITEIDNEDCLVPLASDAPKLRGLPGEYVWTVKDKDGIIEKLYEYDNESDFDSGDTIRRIRQYSVYFDRDCLLDFSK